MIFHGMGIDHPRYLNTVKRVLSGCAVIGILLFNACGNAPMEAAFPRSIVPMIEAQSRQSGSRVLGQQGDDNEATAVLFLLDESGGVNGLCPGVTADQVLVTDSQGQRYEVVQFFLTLWRAYYSLEWLPEEQRASVQLPELFAGVMQFAGSYEEVLSPEVIREDASSLDAVDALLTQLRSPAQMVNLLGLGDNWACKTDYPAALQSAEKTLSGVNANNKVIVLLTDGSFRGSDSVRFHESEQSAAQQRIEPVLKHLSEQKIDVVVVLLDATLCSDEDDRVCTLNNEQHDLRNSGLTVWHGWQDKGLLRLIAAGDLVKGLGNDPALIPLLPGSRHVANWVTAESDGASVQFSGAAEIARLMAVYSGATSEPPRLWVQNDDGTHLVGFAPMSGVLQVDASFQSSTVTGSCSPHTWIIENPDRLTFYYWLLHWNNPNTDPKLSLQVAPQSLAELNRERQIKVSVELDQTACPKVPDCYVATVKAEHSRGEIVHPPKQFSGNQIRHEFDFELPPDLPWGSEVVLTAYLHYKDEPADSPPLDSQSAKVKIAYALEVGQVSQFQESAEQITFSLPITGAKYLPDFANDLRFGLFPEEFADGATLPSTSNGCAKGDECFRQITYQAEKIVGDTVYYRLSAPRGNLWTSQCCYDSLLIQLNDLSIGTMREWRALPSPCPVNDPRDIPWIAVAGIVAFSILLIVVLSWLLRGRR